MRSVSADFCAAAGVAAANPAAPTASPTGSPVPQAGTPAPAAAGTPGAVPGADGNAVFAAHRDYWGVGPVVFYHLDQLGIGDTISVVGAAGEQADYAVAGVDAISADADFTGVISPHGGAEITLITCAGAFTGSEYTDRLIVSGQLQV